MLSNPTTHHLSVINSAVFVVTWYIFNFFSTSNLSDTDLWKEFLARPSLPFILKFLSGMCKGHERSQVISVFPTTLRVI